MWTMLIRELPTIASIVALVIALVKFVIQSVREKNWKEVVKLVTNLMTEAEKKFSTGAERKEWVLVMVKASSDSINYNINMQDVEQLVDDLCAMSKKVNNGSDK